MNTVDLILLFFSLTFAALSLIVHGWTFPVRNVSQSFLEFLQIGLQFFGPDVFRAQVASADP